MEYNLIYSRFYEEIGDDPEFFKKSSEDAYKLMQGWLHSTVNLPFIRKIFNSVSFDDALMELNYKLKSSFSTDEDSDKEFVIDILAQGMVLKWMRPKIDNAMNLAVIIGTDKEKRLQSNYKESQNRLKDLESNLKRAIRDHQYNNGSFGSSGV